MTQKRNGALGTLFALLAAASWLVVSLPATGRAQSSEPEQVVVFIIDLSGSMNEPFEEGQTKLEVAKAAFSEAFDNVADTSLIGIRVYGDQEPSRRPANRQSACESDTRALVPVQPVHRQQILAEVEGLEARGDTAIAIALRGAAADIPAGKSGTIVLFSDGRDECFDADLDGNPDVGPSWGEDPCVVARELAEDDVNFNLERIETVGFRADDAATGQLQCIADATGGSYTPIESASDASSVLPALLVTLGTPREAVRLGGEPIAGAVAAEGAPAISRIESGQAQLRYVDTIAMGEERWYRASEYGPGVGDVTATVFGLPAIEGITLSLRLEPGPEENIRGDVSQTRSNAGLPRAPSASVRCGSCEVIGNDAHDVFWVVSLTSEEGGSGTYDLELLLEGPAWGGLSLAVPGACDRPTECWYLEESAALQSHLDELETEIGRREQLAAQNDSNEAQLADLEDDVAALEEQLTGSGSTSAADSSEQGTGTNWTLPWILGVAIAVGAAALLVIMRARPALDGVTAETDTTAHMGSRSTEEETIEPPARTPEPEPASSPQPGWYDDPEDSNRLRWWDGAQWTTETRAVDDDAAAANADQPLPQPGWYDDPEDPNRLRWWDGEQWTSDVADGELD